MPSTIRQPWCPATMDLYDDRLGTVTIKCTLPANHQGEHQSPRTATDPPSWLAWEEPISLDGTTGGDDA